MHQQSQQSHQHHDQPPQCADLPGSGHGLFIPPKTRPGPGRPANDGPYRSENENPIERVGCHYDRGLRSSPSGGGAGRYLRGLRSQRGRWCRWCLCAAVGLDCSGLLVTSERFGRLVVLWLPMGGAGWCGPMGVAGWSGLSGPGRTRVACPTCGARGLWRAGVASRRCAAVVPGRADAA